MISVQSTHTCVKIKHGGESIGNCDFNQKRREVRICVHLVIFITFTLRGHGENHSALSRCYVSSYLQGKEVKVYQLGEFLSKRAG